jgi:hypothetical protein
VADSLLARSMPLRAGPVTPGWNHQCKYSRSAGSRPGDARAAVVISVLREIYAVRGSSARRGRRPRRAPASAAARQPTTRRAPPSEDRGAAHEAESLGA